MKPGTLIVAGIDVVFSVIGFLLYEPTCDNELYRSLRSVRFALR